MIISKTNGDDEHCLNWNIPHPPAHPIHLQASRCHSLEQSYNLSFTTY